nr:hypothetical protein [Streptomyces albus]
MTVQALGWYASADHDCDGVGVGAGSDHCG